MMFTPAHLIVTATAAAAFTAAVSIPPSVEPSLLKRSQFTIQWTGLSKPCQESLATLVDSKSDISQCSRVGTLFNEAVSKSAVNPDESLVQPLQAWLEDELCAKAPCDSVTVTAAYTAVTDACAAELQKQRWIPMAAQGALLNYETARKTMCLKDTSANDNSTSYCPAEVLNNIETSGTPITWKQGQLALENPQAAVDAVPTWTYCQPCSQGLMAPVVNVLRTLYPEWATQVESAVDGRCGAGFASGDIPTPLADGITYKSPDSEGGNGTSGGGTGDSGDGTGFEEGSTGFKTQAFAHPAVLLISVALLALTTL